MKKWLLALLVIFSGLSARPWDPVLNYWFEELKPAQWWNGGPQVDAEIKERFGSLLMQAERGELRSWNETARGQLGLIIVLDQFSRNVYRGTPQAFANDARARAIACDMVIKGSDRRLSPRERVFAYLPFEHAENLACQNQAIELFTKLVEETGEFQSYLNYAQQHRDLIVRFGRFPHRNAILDRRSSKDEQAYLAQPGAGF